MLTRLLEKLMPAKASGKPLASSAGVPNLAQETEWRPGDTILGRYKVEQVFSGAMGKVYIAQHLGWNIPVAIKVPRPEVLADEEGAKRIFTEADSWVRMGMHPNVATCFYVMTIDKIPHLFIEFVDGGDLSAWLKAGRCKDQRTSLSMAIQFCHGMEFTHSKGIIHRDIKPQNILVTRNALVKITDFGIVQSIKHPDANSSSPLPDTSDNDGTIGFRGTPGYASPEQFRDTHGVDRRTDIFSFGICLWLMFCGRKPFKNNQIPEPAEPTPPSGSPPFPKALIHLLKKSVAYDPNLRYQDFKDLRTDLNQAHIDLFRIDCPYMEVDFTDLEAENYNNRAVSYLELNKTKEAALCLARAMEINDSLPEAIYNDTLLRWRTGKPSVTTLYRETEAVRQRLPKAKLLEVLSQSLKKNFPPSTKAEPKTTDKQSAKSQESTFPEYALCLPKNSADVFRTSQLHLASQRNIVDLLAKGQYQQCHEVLSRSWENIGYRKDQVFLDTYEQLVHKGAKKKIKAIVRLMTLPAAGGVATWLTSLPGSKKIILLNKNGEVMLRHYGPGQKIKILDSYQNATALALSPDQQLLALACPGGIHLLMIKSGAVDKVIMTPSRVTALTFSTDSTLLTYGCETSQLFTVDLASGKTMTISTGKNGPARSIVYFDKRHDFVSGHEDGALCFWEHGARDCHRQLEAHAMPVTILSPSSNGALFLSGAADRIIKIWNRQNGQCLKSIKPHDDAINAALILPDNTHLVSASDDDLIKIWNMDSGICLHTLDGRGDGIRSLAMGPQPHILLAGRNDGAIIAWMVIYDLDFS